MTRKKIQLEDNTEDFSEEKITDVFSFINSSENEPLNNINISKDTLTEELIVIKIVKNMILLSNGSKIKSLKMTDKNKDIKVGDKIHL